MKEIFSALAVFACCLSASSQMVLNVGETYTYQFTNMQYTGGLPFGGPSSAGELDLLSATNMGLEIGDALLLEVFEDTPTGNPILTRTLTVSSGPFGILLLGGWQDRTGSFRLTMLSGSGLIGTIVANSYTTVIGNGTTFYSLSVTPPPRPRLEFVPSPAALTLHWPTSALNFVLESSTNVISPIAWQTVTNAALTNSGKISVPVSREEERRFFRLRLP